MSYHRNRTALQPAPLGDVASVIATAVDVSRDPYFSETVCRARQLYAIENRESVPACLVTPPGLTGGIGLRKVMPALREYVRAEQQPLRYIAGAAVVLGVPLLLGIAIGRSR